MKMSGQLNSHWRIGFMYVCFIPAGIHLEVIESDKKCRENVIKNKNKHGI
jgi:hypothetical protein